MLSATPYLDIMIIIIGFFSIQIFVASELKDPICHSDECQTGSFSSGATNMY